MQVLKTIRDILNKVLGGMNVFLFAFMVVIGTYQILVRYLFNSPSTVSEELLTYSFSWMALLAASYVFGKREHMRMGFLADKLQEGAKKILDIIIEGIIFIFAVIVMLYGGIQIVSLTMIQKTASLGISMGYIYLIIPICGGLIMIYSILNIIDIVCGTKKTKK